MAETLQLAQRDLLRVCLVGRVESERIENGEMMEKWENRKDFNFSHFCLVDSKKVGG